MFARCGAQNIGKEELFGVGKGIKVGSLGETPVGTGQFARNTPRTEPTAAVAREMPVGARVEAARVLVCKTHHWGRLSH
jgi:hypothetical protein